MKKLNQILSAGCIIIFASCQQQNNEQAIKDTIDRLHNEAMVINEKANKTKFTLDSLLEKKRAENKADTVEISKAIAQLNLADEQMMDWMHNFKLDFKGTEAEALKYFDDQLDSVKKVQVQLETAIAEAKPLVK
jgi:hypothetical protein